MLTGRNPTRTRKPAAWPWTRSAADRAAQPLLRGLCLFVPFWKRTPYIHGYSALERGTQLTNAAPSAANYSSTDGKYGVYVSKLINNASAVTLLDSARTRRPSSAITVVMVYTPTASSSTTNAALWSKNRSGGTSYALQQSGTNAFKFRFSITNSLDGGATASTGDLTADSIALTAGTRYVFVGRWRAGGKVQLDIYEADTGLLVDSKQSGTSPAGVIYYDGGQWGTLQVPGDHDVGYMWDRYLSDNRARLLTLDPYLPLRRRDTTAEEFTAAPTTGVTGTGTTADGGQQVAGAGAATPPSTSGTGSTSAGGQQSAGSGAATTPGAVSGSGGTTAGGETTSGAGSATPPSIAGSGTTASGGQQLAAVGGVLTASWAGPIAPWLGGLSAIAPATGTGGTGAGGQSDTGAGTQASPIDATGGTAAGGQQASGAGGIAQPTTLRRVFGTLDAWATVAGALSGGAGAPATSDTDPYSISSDPEPVVSDVLRAKLALNTDGTLDLDELHYVDEDGATVYLTAALVTFDLVPIGGGTALISGGTLAAVAGSATGHYQASIPYTLLGTRTTLVAQVTGVQTIGATTFHYYDELELAVTLGGR